MIGFQRKMNKLQGVPIIVKILLCQTWVKQCLTQQDFYNDRNTLQFIQQKQTKKKVKDIVKDHHSAVT